MAEQQEEEGRTRVRPTFALLRELGVNLPPLDTPIDNVEHPLVKKAQPIPDQFRVGQAVRIKRLKQRYWLRVKHEACRGAVTRLKDDDELVVKHSLSEGDRWWLCFCGERAEDSPQKNFYDVVSDEYANSRLPNNDDFERLFAEVGVGLVRALQTAIRRCAYISLNCGRAAPIEYAGRSLVTAIRSFHDGAVYMSLSINEGAADNEYVVALTAFDGVAPEDWYPEHELAVDILGETEGRIVFSALLPPEVQSALLNEGDAKGWPKGLW